MTKEDETEEIIPTHNKISISDIEITSPEPLDKIEEMINRLISKHKDFLISRRREIMSWTQGYLG